MPPPKKTACLPHPWHGVPIGEDAPQWVRAFVEITPFDPVSERPISRPGVLLTARVVGGVPVLDGGLADDKILAVLEDDPAWGDVDSIDGLPAELIARYRHYFET